MSVRTLPDARWSCRGCADCCRGFSFGPVTDEVVAGLRARRIEADWPPAAASPWVERRAEGWFLTHRDGHCVFLQDDGRCAVHRLHGAGAKPDFCRAYPLLVVEDEGEAPAVVVRADCGGHHESFADGEPVGTQVDGLLDLAVPRVPPHAGGIEVLPGMAVDGSTWAALRPRLLDRLLARRLAPEPAVADLRGAILSAAGRSLPPVDADAPRQALLEALRATLARVVDAAPPGAEARRAGFERVQADLDRALHTPPLPLSSTAIDYFGLLLRGELLGRRFLASGGLPAGLGRFLLDVTIARAAGPTTAELGPVLSRWLRVSAHPGVQALLQRARPALVELFLGAS